MSTDRPETSPPFQKQLIMKTTDDGWTGSTAMSETLPDKLSYWRVLVDHAGITKDVACHEYAGSGTQEDPYLASWLPDDPRNPMGWTSSRHWGYTLVAGVATLAVTLVSSAYSGSMQDIMVDFQVSSEVATLGISLFVLGFAVGPLLWAPMSELYGRQVIFISTFALFTAFNAGCAAARNAETLVTLRFFAGAFGSSPLTNGGGMIADMFPASQRGLAMAMFAIAPVIGPVLGPIVGGYLGLAAGWRWVMGFLAAFTGLSWTADCVLVPETYAPVLLRSRAGQLSAMTGRVYVSRLDHEKRGAASPSALFRTALSRPWVLLFREPIVLLLSVFMAIIYGTLYLFFAAFPIVFQKQRGWDASEGGLAFLGIAVGLLSAFGYIMPDNRRYVKVQAAHRGRAPPESRLPPCLVGTVALPIGLFWFAWTCQPSVHYMVSIAAGVPFGFGMNLVFLAIMNYLIDSYTIYAASVLAANSVLRSLCGAAFPLFTRHMYEKLGVNWATSVPAFLALACVPFPFLFYYHGASIRLRCRFSAESEAFMQRMMQSASATR